jgi:hypothetical protein
MKLITTPNIRDVDTIYQRLIDAHEGRSESDSIRLNARLILTLINHIGDPEAVFEAITLAADVDKR